MCNRWAPRKLRLGPCTGTKLRNALSRPLRRSLAAVLLLCSACAIASCDGSGGGNDEKQDVQDLLDRAFRQEIRSADMKIDAQLQVTGGESATDRPVHIRATGPFSGNDRKLPSVDLELAIGNDGGQTVQTGFLSTGDRAFLKFQDVYYEQPAASVKRANESLARNKGKRSSLSSLGLDPRSWLAEAREEDDETVAGVPVKHVSGTLDVAAVMSDLNEFVRRSGSAINGATGQSAPEPLTSSDIDKVAQVVKSPSFDVYVGRDDEIIRRVSGRLEVTVPKRDRERVGGIESGSLEFSIEFREVNEPVKIVAPARARPLDALTRSLGPEGIDQLGGLGDDAGDGQGQAPSDGSGGTGTMPPAEGQSEDEKAFQEYAECLEQTRPDDTEALQRCAQLLTPGGIR
jgi:hypothetical protein